MQTISDQILYLIGCPGSGLMRDTEATPPLVLDQHQLLWVVAATDPHVISTGELLDDGSAKGYVERFAPYEGDRYFS